MTSWYRAQGAQRWEQRRNRFARKFRDAETHLGDLFTFKPTSLRRIAIVGFSTTGRSDSLGEGVEVKSLQQFMKEVTADLIIRHPLKNAVPETLPLLRAMQFALHWGQRQI